MNRRALCATLGAVTLLLAVRTSAPAAEAGGAKQNTNGLRKVTTNDSYRTILINNIFDYYGNNGDGSYNPFSADNEGFEFPKGSSGHIIFEQGIVWTGFNGLVDPVTGQRRPSVLKAGGSTYAHGLQAGKILQPGTATTRPVADDPNNPKYRMYRVRPDIRPATNPDSINAYIAILNNEEVPLISRYESFTAQQLYQQYVDDWNQWPAADGAPFTDVNHDGVYEPNIDIPGVPGADQTLWYVANDMDLSRVTNLYGASDALGLEQQTTIWAYKRAANTALGNTVFASTKLINKSGTEIDSMYVSAWSDPDMGGSLGYRDNFSGCDTSRNLGFVYNGNACNPDPTYGCSPPAGGQVFFQGPIVPSPGDSAVFQLQRRYNFRNLGMSAFNFFINGSQTYRDPRLGDPRGTEDWYNLMRGLTAFTGSPYTDPTTGQTTKFTLDGDPVIGKGWNDGTVAPPDDRRQCMITGPFTMMPGDTQEIVLGTLAARGSDKLSSISVLRYYTDIVQQAYNDLFVLPSPPQAPKVTATSLDGEVLLNWSDPATVAQTESQDDKGYRFQGYNVYQLRTQSFSDEKRLATFDIVDGALKIQDYVYDDATGTVILKPVQFGNDTGIKRYFDVTADAFSTFSNRLIDGQTYYFAVTAYNFNAAPGLKGNNLESAPQIIAVTPHGPDPGNSYSSHVGQVLTNVNQIFSAPATGLSDGSLDVRVIDPTKITGHVYKVTFSGADTSKSWALIDSTTGQQKFSGIRTYGDNDANPIVDGIQVSVLDPGAAGGFKQGLLIRNGSTDLSSNPPSIIHAFDPTNAWAFDIIGSTGSSSALTRLGGSLEGSDDYEIRVVDPAQGSQYYSSEFQVAAGDHIGPDRMPVQFWDITKNIRLVPAIRDADGDGRFTTDVAEGPGPSNGITTLTGGVWDAIYVQDPLSFGPYAEPLANPATANSNGFAFRRVMFVNSDTTRTAPFPVPSGTVIRLITNKPVTPNHTFAFNTAGAAPTLNNVALAQADVAKINVFPNPYFGFNAAEINKYNRFVTFNHLPAHATIRIFNLAGVLIKTIVKTDPGQFAQWDLRNEAGFPAAAGMYIVFVDMPDIGQSKTLKLAIIPETQFLDRL